MRELERHSQPPSAATLTRPQRVAAIGRGRAGASIAGAFSAAGVAVDGAVEPGPAVGHCSGATGLDVLAPHPAFSLHPLMTFAGDGRPVGLAGAGAAVAGSTPQMLAVARALAAALGLQSIEVAPEDRIAYHAAASIASNFLVTLEAAAERLAAGAGVERRLLVPLVRTTVENWANLGPERALTGPVARGDNETVARQRAAVAERTPELLELFDGLVTATRALAGARAVHA